MTDDDAPARAAGKGPEADLLREMIGFAASLRWNWRSAAKLALAVKNPNRLSQRDGYRESDTRAGTVELCIPNCAKAPTFRGTLHSAHLDTLGALAFCVSHIGRRHADPAQELSKLVASRKRFYLGCI